MSDTQERFCPHCGRANPASMLRCINCGQRMMQGRSFSETASAPVRGSAPLQFAQPEEADSTLRVPWWQTSPAGEGTIPAPPQVRDEARRHALRQIEVAEREAQNRERYSEYLTERERLRLARAAAEQELGPFVAEQAATTLANCPNCGTKLGEAGKTFSFCLHCGQDVPTSTKPPVGRTQTHAHMPGQERAREYTAATAATAATAGVASTTFGVEKGTQTRYTERTRRAHRTAAPGIAAVLSFFLPGVGQIVNGQTAKGVFLLLAFLVLVPLLGAGVLGFLVQAVAAVDAYRIAQRRRDGGIVREDEWDLGRKR